MSGNNKCSVRVYSGGSYMGYPCGKSAKVERDGKHYCGTHDPVRVAARAAARETEFQHRWQAQKQAQKAADAERAETKRRADAYPALVAALDEILSYGGGADSALDDEYVMDRARAALDSAQAGLKVGP